MKRTLDGCGISLSRSFLWEKCYLYPGPPVNREPIYCHISLYFLLTDSTNIVLKIHYTEWSFISALTCVHYFLLQNMRIRNKVIFQESLKTLQGCVTPRAGQQKVEKYEKKETYLSWRPILGRMILRNIVLTRNASFRKVLIFWTAILWDEINFVTTFFISGPSNIRIYTIFSQVAHPVFHTTIPIFSQTICGNILFLIYEKNQFWKI